VADMRNAHKILLGDPEGKRQLGRQWRKWEDIIKMYLKEIGCEYILWIYLTQNSDQWRAPVNTVMNLWVP